MAIALAAAALCRVYYLFASELYLYSDNIGVAVVLNGSYADPLSQYQHPLFCLLIYALSRVFPSADMYTVFVHLLVFLELTVLMMILPSLSSGKGSGDRDLTDLLMLGITVLYCVFLSAGLNIWRANYTITAASFLFTGWLCILKAGDRENERLWITVGTLFAAFGFMLRKEAGLLFLPFLLLLFAADRLRDDSRRPPLSETVRRCLPACLVLLLLFLSQVAFNSVEPYATARRYNEARTTMVDFPVREWDAAVTDTAREDYIGAENWLFSDTEVMNADTLESMARQSAKNEFDFTQRGIRGALKKMYRVAAKTDVYMSVMVVLCLLLAVGNTVSQRPGWLKLIAFLAVAGAFVILFYYTFRGRAPLRVWQPVLFGVLLTETGLFVIGESSVRRDTGALFLLAVFALMFYSAGQVISHTEFHRPHTPLTARTGADESVYEETLRGDDLYIWPNWHGEIPKHFGEMGKLPTKRVLEHNIALGDWTSGQPYYTRFLERIGHPNPIGDLAEGGSVYIMSNSDYILDFLRLHYGEDIELEEAGTVNGKTAYRAVRTGS